VFPYQTLWLCFGKLITKFSLLGQKMFSVEGAPGMTEMTQLNRLVEQHILEHESHLKHLDELIERAEEKISKTGGGEAEELLAKMKLERDQLSSRVEEFKLKPPDQWSEEEFEKTGPMVIWDTLAQKLEKLIERIEH
jgi:hypothetical protein